MMRVNYQLLFRLELLDVSLGAYGASMSPGTEEYLSIFKKLNTPCPGKKRSL